MLGKTEYTLYRVSRVHETSWQFAQDLAKALNENKVLERCLNKSCADASYTRVDLKKSCGDLSYAQFELNNSYVFIEMKKDTIVELKDKLALLEDKHEGQKGIIEAQQDVITEQKGIIKSQLRVITELMRAKGIKKVSMNEPYIADGL